MFKEAFSQFNESNLIVLGLLLFMLTFLGALIWTFLIQKDNFYTRLSLMPFENDDVKGDVK